MNSFTFLIGDEFVKREIYGFERNIPIIIEAVNEDNFDKIKEKVIYLFGESCECVLIDKEGQTTEIQIKDLELCERFIIKAASYLARTSYTFSDLIEIIRRLRDPDGCEWDREQTHESIRANAVEEAFELVEAIDLKDRDKMIEESGDVMLQGLFHAIIAEDSGNFSLNDIINGLCTKLVTRHPHVFGENKAKNAKEALQSWENAKATEKNQGCIKDKLDSVPVTFGALLKAKKVDKIIKKTGFDFANENRAKAKIMEELAELEQAKTQQDKEWEGGDLLYAVNSYLTRIGVDGEMALNATTKRFIKRFSYVEKMAKEKGFELSKDNIEIMEKYYQESKKFEV